MALALSFWSVAMGCRTIAKMVPPAAPRQHRWWLSLPHPVTCICPWPPSLPQNGLTFISAICKLQCTAPNHHPGCLTPCAGLGFTFCQGAIVSSCQAGMPYRMLLLTSSMKPPPSEPRPPPPSSSPGPGTRQPTTVG